MKASNDEFGDPCPGTGKYLQVNYICEGIRVYVYEFK